MNAVRGHGVGGAAMAAHRLKGAKGGGKSGGKKAKAPITAPDSLRSNTIARIFDIYSEGPCGGLVDGLKSVYFRIGTTLTPVMNADGSLNIEGVSIAEVFGTADQAFIAGTPAVEYEKVVNTQFTTESPAVVEITDADLDAIRVKVLWPRITYVDGKGNVVGASMDIAIDVQSFGGSFVEVRRDQFSGKTETAYEREYLIPLPPGGNPWTVRCRRNQADSSGLRNYDSFWSSYTGVIWAKQTYPWCAGVHTTVDARQFGEDIAGRAFKVLGREWQIPANYDPVTRTYATEGPGTSGGIWDGTFTTGVTGNPAWVFYGLATNKRFGAGDFIEPWMVDKWELYRIAQYCDQLIDDGRGGQIPRFEINTQINSQDSAARVLQMVAAAARSFAYWGGGETPLRLRQDRPRDPSRLFSPSNIVGGSVNRETADDLLQHSAAEVSWTDPNDGMSAQIAVVQDVELVQKLGYRPLQIGPFGCDNEARAIYFGRWALEVEKLDETYSFAVGLHDADTEPGEHCLLADPLMMDVRYGGLVTAATTTSIDIDTAVELLFGEDYVLTVELPDGSLAERAVTNAAGSTGTITWSDPLDAVPVAGAQFNLSCGAVAPESISVLNVTENEQHSFEITAQQYDPGIYDRVESGLDLPAKSYSLLPTGPLGVPQNLAVRGWLSRNGPSPMVGAIFSWTPAPDARVRSFEIEIQPPGHPGFTVADDVDGVSYSLSDIDTGPVTFRVRGVDGIGRRSAWALFSGAVTPLGERPVDVENFTITVLGDIATGRWDDGVDYDIDHWWIKFQPVTSGASWESAIDLERAARVTPFQMPAMVGTYLIKAVDILGNESLNAASVVNLSGGLSYFNVEELVAEDPLFDGVMDGVELDYDLNAIALSAGESEGIYYFANRVVLDGIYTSRINARVDAGAVNENQDILAVDDILALEDWFGAAAGSWGAELQYRITLEDPNDSPASWSNWLPVFVGDVTFYAIEFRLILRRFAEGIKPYATVLRVNVDMPDIDYGALNVAVPDSGLTVAFPFAYRSLKALSITLLDGVTGDYIDLVAQSETEFSLFVRDAGGSAIAGRHINWDSAGWGRIVTT